MCIFHNNYLFFEDKYFILISQHLQKNPNKKNHMDRYVDFSGSFGNYIIHECVSLFGGGVQAKVRSYTGD